MKHNIEKNSICIADAEVLIKRYKVRGTGKAKSTIETTIPKEAFDREMRRLGLSPKEAIGRILAVWRYNDFQGLHLCFELREKNI